MRAPSHSHIANLPDVQFRRYEFTIFNNLQLETIYKKKVC